PLIKLHQQEEKTAQAATNVERSKLLPDFSVGYNNTTLRDGIRFDGNDRFQSIQLGMSIPLLGASQRNRIRSARTFEELKKSETADVRQRISTTLKSALRQYDQQLSLVNDLKKDGLRTADEITSTLN